MLGAKADDTRSGAGGQTAGRADRSWVLWLVVAAVGVHIIEEYTLNFDGWALRALGAPVSWQDFHLVNAGVIVYCVACAVVGWRWPAFALSSAALVMLNAAGFHIAFSLVLGLYSPGAVTSALLFLPAGAAAYRAAALDGVLTRRAVVWSVVIGLAWHAFLGGVFWLKYFAPVYP